MQGGFPGTGNLNTDPLFIDANGSDDVAGTPDDDLHVVDFSPATDSGSNTSWTVALTTDFAGFPRFTDNSNVPNGGEGRAPIIDRGPYEWQPDRPACNFADLDCDGDVDGEDLGLLLGAWDTMDDTADLDDDGLVSGGDLGLLLGSWTG